MISVAQTCWKEVRGKVIILVVNNLFIMEYKDSEWGVNVQFNQKVVDVEVALWDATKTWL